VAAESLLGISYTITSPGTFSGLNLNGPITGGSLTYTPPGGSVLTPFSCRTATATSCGSMQLTLIGTAGTFTAMLPAVGSMYITQSYVQGFASSGSGASGADFAAIFTLFNLYGTASQEVRTVPEPSPRFLQLGVAIGLLGILGARTGIAATRAPRARWPFPAPQEGSLEG
jgi:hypothetical protein